MSTRYLTSTFTSVLLQSTRTRMAQACGSAVLHSFWASSCSWRVRAALHHKGVPFTERAVDIIAEKEQLTHQYRSVNPAQKVPALEIGELFPSSLDHMYITVDGVVLVESMAILQYLEDTRPAPPLQPAEPLMKARVWEICETIAAGIQPLQNPGLRPQFATEAAYDQFTRYHTDRGLQTLEALLARSSGDFCVGSHLTLADLCFVPQIYNAINRLKLDVSKYTTVSRLYSHLSTHALFVATSPRAVKPK